MAQVIMGSDNNQRLAKSDLDVLTAALDALRSYFAWITQHDEYCASSFERALYCYSEYDLLHLAAQLYSLFDLKSSVQTTQTQAIPQRQSSQALNAYIAAALLTTCVCFGDMIRNNFEPEGPSLELGLLYTPTEGPTALLSGGERDSDSGDDSDDSDSRDSGFGDDATGEAIGDNESVLKSNGNNNENSAISLVSTTATTTATPTAVHSTATILPSTTATAIATSTTTTSSRTEECPSPPVKTLLDKILALTISSSSSTSSFLLESVWEWGEESAAIATIVASALK